MSRRIPGPGTPFSGFRTPPKGKNVSVIDPYQSRALEMQMHQVAFSQQSAQQQLMTQQSALALDACTFIVSHDSAMLHDAAVFSDDVVRDAYATIERISWIFAPQVGPPQAPPEKAE